MTDAVCGCGHRCRVSESESEPISLAQVIGRNSRGLRLASDAQLQQVATAMKRQGVSWSTGRVGDLESGRVSATLSTVFCLMQALTEVIGNQVTMSDLLHGEKDVLVNENAIVPLAQIRAKLGIK